MEADQVRLHSFWVNGMAANLARHHLGCIEGRLVGERRCVHLVISSPFAMFFAFVTAPTTVFFMRHLTTQTTIGC